MHKYTPLAESDSTEASTMHGVRLAVACGVHCKHVDGSLKVRGARITAECMHTHFSGGALPQRSSVRAMLQG